MKIGVVLCSVIIISLLAFGGFFVFLSAEGDKRVADVLVKADRLRQDDPFAQEREFCSEDIESRFAVSASSADELLTNRLARDMITKGGVAVTDGYGWAEISIGGISDAFDAFDTVDINRLKELKLIPKDSYKIKITSDGKIDKSLRVYANDFDIVAVKMIILSGGSAIKVKSKRKNI